MDQAGTLRELSSAKQSGAAAGGHIRGVAVASGKGGVGKTNIVANMAFELSRKGSRVLVFDADMGLGNIHILLGMSPKFNVGHVLAGSKGLKEILVEGPGGMKILPASTGAKQYSEISANEKLVLKTELEVLQNDFDYILFDIGAGISANVMFFCAAVQDIIVIASTEPTSFSDAYALMKILSRDFRVHRFRLLINSCRDRKEALGVYHRLVTVSDRFRLGIKIDFIGHVTQDESVTKAVRKQRLFCDLYPRSDASKCVAGLVDMLVNTIGDGELEWDRIFGVGGK
ncbi:MAG: site-determining protein [bacterium]|nr:MAG: site-determining protein [bacterium]